MATIHAIALLMVMFASFSTEGKTMEGDVDFSRVLEGYDEPSYKGDVHFVRQLRSTLREYAYSENLLIASFGFSVLIPGQMDDTSRLEAQLPQSPCGDLLRFFFLSYGLPEERLLHIFDAAFMEWMKDVRLAVSLRIGEDTYWKAYVLVYPVGEELFFATDHLETYTVDGVAAYDPVMYIGRDSMSLVNNIPMSHAPSRVLDLCCGAGIQGIYHAYYFSKAQVVSVDINPRAVRFTNFNALLNGVEDRLQVLDGNLYEALSSIAREERFDVILANPPYIPTPATHVSSGGVEWTFGTSGADGEDALRAIICGAPQWLNRHVGRMHIVTQLMNAEDYDSKLLNWWEEQCTNNGEAMPSMDFFVYYGYPVPREEYAHWYAQSSSLYAYGATLENLEVHNITTVANGYIYAFTSTREDSLPSSSSYRAQRVYNPLGGDDTSNVWNVMLGRELAAVQHQWPAQHRLPTQEWMDFGRRRGELLLYV